MEAEVVRRRGREVDSAEASSSNTPKRKNAARVVDMMRCLRR